MKNICSHYNTNRSISKSDHQKNSKSIIHKSLGEFSSLKLNNKKDDKVFLIDEISKIFLNIEFAEKSFESFKPLFTIMSGYNKKKNSKNSKRLFSTLRTRTKNQLSSIAHSNKTNFPSNKLLVIFCYNI